MEAVLTFDCLRCSVIDVQYVAKALMILSARAISPETYRFPSQCHPVLVAVP